MKDLPNIIFGCSIKLNHIAYNQLMLEFLKFEELNL